MNSVDPTQARTSIGFQPRPSRQICRYCDGCAGIRAAHASGGEANASSVLALALTANWPCK
eukprot:363316-Chlamydomonas_euryale.AAC.5